jgi:magnesium-transporting ATPase (P-type)
MVMCLVSCFYSEDGHPFRMFQKFWSVNLISVMVVWLVSYFLSEKLVEEKKSKQLSCFSLHGVAPFFLFLLFISLFVCFGSFIFPYHSEYFSHY